MMAFKNLTEVLVLKRGRSATRHVEKQVPAYGKIRGENQTSSALLHQLADSRQFAIPSRGADHNALSPTNASFNILQNHGWVGEVDGYVDRGKLVRAQSGAMQILGSTDHIHMV